MGKRHRSSSSPLATLCLYGLQPHLPCARFTPPIRHTSPAACDRSCGPLLGTATSGLEQLISLLALVDGVAVVHRARAEDLRTAEGGIHLPLRDFSSQQFAKEPQTRAAAATVRANAWRAVTRQQTSLLRRRPAPCRRRTGVAAGTPPCLTRDPRWLCSHAYRRR